MGEHGPLQDLRRDAEVDVVTDARLLASYDHDWWPLAAKRSRLGQPMGHPDAFAQPTSAEQVADLLRHAREHRVPLIPWGLGSSVVGAPLATEGGIVCDLSRLTGITALSAEDLLVSVRAGTMGADLEAELNAAGLTLGHSPQSLDRSTVGGWVATRATGQFSSRYGGIEDLLVAVEVALPEHGLVRTPIAARPALGPDLAGLLVGAEGTLGIVTEVTLRLSPLPTEQHLESLAFDEVEPMVATMREIMAAGLRPFLIRGYDHAETAHLSHGAVEGCALLLGTQGTLADPVRAEHEATLAIAEAHGGKRLGSALAEGWMARRFDVSTIEALVEEPGGYAETIEVAALWSGIVELHEELTKALAPHADEVLGHFSHAYPQGTSLYVIMLGRADDDPSAVRRIEAFWEVAMEVCERQGAAPLHHHGIGLARHRWLPAALGDAAAPLAAITRALDPERVCNPGKLTDPPSPH